MTVYCPVTTVPRVPEACPIKIAVSENIFLTVQVYSDLFISRIHRSLLRLSADDGRSRADHAVLSFAQGKTSDTQGGGGGVILRENPHASRFGANLSVSDRTYYSSISL